MSDPATLYSGLGRPPTDPDLVQLIAASIAFVGSHFAMSHPLRAPMVKLFGEKLFPAIYSVVSAAAMVWMYLAFTAIETPNLPLWQGFGDISWGLASVLTLLAMVLFAGSFIGNPALPAPGAEKAARAEPTGVFRVTRHPMMWAFALWAISHIIAAPTDRTLVVATAVLLLALVGSHMQDRKKQVLMGDAWAEWESKTSYWPRLGSIFGAGAVAWIGGLVLWLALSWVHIPLGGWQAGIWRWIG